MTFPRSYVYSETTVLIARAYYMVFCEGTKVQEDMFSKLTQLAKELPFDDLFPALRQRINYILLESKDFTDSLSRLLSAFLVPEDIQAQKAYLHKALCEYSLKHQCKIADLIAEDLSIYPMKDPLAVQNLLDVYLNYQGFHGIATQRIMHMLWLRNKPGDRESARYLERITVASTGMDLHPGASLGRKVGCDHAIGVVVGETSIIGDDCWILHAVTLGGNGREKDKRRHPEIGNNVFIGAGCLILGPWPVPSHYTAGAGTFIATEKLSQQVEEEYGKQIDKIPGPAIVTNPRQQVIRYKDFSE